jgi:hypothetical protein
MRASSRRRARAPTARRFFALFSSLAVAARAAPDRVGCDRKVSGVDIMTKSRIMNRTPSVGSFVTASAPTYGPNDSITITLTGLASAAFAHASAGTATTISGFTAKSCGGTAQQYANSGASGTKTFTWTAPADLTSVSSVDISAGYAAGQGAVTRQTITLTRATGAACATNQRVSSGACVACPAGSTRAAGDPVYGGDTTCTATLCATNERVSNNACVACAGSATNAAGDDATQSDTTCDGAACASNQHVSSSSCTACPAGTTRAAGDPVYGGDTTCTATACGANERVSNNACVACAAYTTNAAGDLANGGDTACDAASAAPAGPKFIVFALFTALACACARVA